MKRFFCSSVPYFISAGPTHQIAIWLIACGARARTISSLRIACSIRRPAPPYSFGHAAPRKPPVQLALPGAGAVQGPVLVVRRDVVLQPLPDLGVEGFLFGGVRQIHGSSSWLMRLGRVVAVDAATIARCSGVSKGPSCTTRLPSGASRPTSFSGTE